LAFDSESVLAQTGHRFRNAGGHGDNRVLARSHALEALKVPEERAWLARQAVEHGWSRAVLTHQIEGRLSERAERAPTNFAQTLPSPQSDLARELLKAGGCYAPGELCTKLLHNCAVGPCLSEGPQPSYPRRLFARHPQ
jgi:hypothetical protein